jgi:hypothetical protein
MRLPQAERLNYKPDTRIVQPDKNAPRPVEPARWPNVAVSIQPRQDGIDGRPQTPRSA